MPYKQYLLDLIPLPAQKAVADENSDPNKTFDKSTSVANKSNLYSNISNVLLANGWEIDGATSLERRAEVDKPTLYPPWALITHTGKNYRPLARCKESLKPNRDLFNDRDTFIVVTFTDARAANEQTGEGMADFYAGVKSPIGFLHHRNAPPYSVWGKRTTPLVSYHSTNTLGSRGVHLDATAHGPFHDFVCDQLAFLTSPHTYHYYYEKSPAPKTAAVTLFELYIAYGLGEDDNYIFSTVWSVLRDVGWCTLLWGEHDEYADVYLTPKGVELMPVLDVDRSYHKVSLAKHGLVENIHYFVNKDRMIRDVYEYGPRRPEDFPALIIAADFRVESYVRLTVSVRHRLLYFLSRMTKKERQHMLDIAARHKSDLSKTHELQ